MNTSLFKILDCNCMHGRLVLTLRSYVKNYHLDMPLLNGKINSIILFAAGKKEP